jgi:hypothetical protein
MAFVSKRAIGTQLMQVLESLTGTAPDDDSAAR